MAGLSPAGKQHQCEVTMDSLSLHQAVSSRDLSEAGIYRVWAASLPHGAKKKPGNWVQIQWPCTGAHSHSGHQALSLKWVMFGGRETASEEGRVGRQTFQLLLGSYI